jgi:hypothetical protein
MNMMQRVVFLVLALLSAAYGFGVHTPVFGARSAPVSMMNLMYFLEALTGFPRGLTGFFAIVASVAR